MKPFVKNSVEENISSIFTVKTGYFYLIKALVRDISYLRGLVFVLEENETGREITEVDDF